MDIKIVNGILQLCVEKQICLFEISFLYDYCLEENLCTNIKYILASIKNYMEIFKLSRDENRIEFFMPFEICRNKYLNGICQHNENNLCSNFHLCYDYFYKNSCHRSINCPYPHILTEEFHGNILQSLINLDLNLLSKAFRVYCQSNKHLVNHNSSRGQLNSSLRNKPTPSSLMINNCRMILIPQLNGNSTWKINTRPVNSSKKQQIIPQILEKGLQICWKPQKDIQLHFIEVVFSNQSKSNGGPIRTHQVYQHLGVAQVFYQDSNILDQVILHQSITFQSFTFIPRLLQRTIDMRHICLSNIPIDINHLESYIDIISMPYKKLHFEYYQNDKQIIVIEYNEDIDFSKIFLNVRNHPEYNGSIIKCIQLYLPEILFIEYNENYSEDYIRKLFDKENIFHIKTYSYCSFLHFYSHHDLQQTMNKTFDNFIRITPIYIDIYSSYHLNNYLQQRQIEIEKNLPLEKEIIDPSSSSSIPILPLPSIEQQIDESNVNSDDDDGDNFHDLPSDFDNDDLFLDESNDNNGDMEFLRNAAKNLMSNLSEMEEASSDTDIIDAPHSLLYGDDYIVTIKNRRFALAFLDYTQFRVEKQRNPDKYHLLASLKKLKTKKNVSLENSQIIDQTSNNETKMNKKKRNKHHKKKKNTNEEIQLTTE